MQQLEDIDPECREETYLGKLPKELRQLIVKYMSTCDYSITILSSDEINKVLAIVNRSLSVGCYIPFQRGTRSRITMKKFLSNVKMRVRSEYDVSPYHILSNNEKGNIGLFCKKDYSGHFLSMFTPCRELEDALLEMEAFQNMPFT